MVLRQNIPKLTVGRILRIDYAPTVFVIINLICYYRDVETRTECQRRWRNSLLQCLWSQPASKRHSQAVTAINFIPNIITTSCLSCWNALSIETPYLCTECIPSYEQFTVLRPVTVKSASRIHTKSQFIFFFNPACKCDHSSFMLWTRTGNVPVSKNHTMNMCGRAEEQVRTHQTSGSATC